ncbi:hypothetical protein [Spiroplasma endosymbiont of Aleiodes alternator]|uniref:hypothetical protein n=1 Tax=Spiroplasma endosymbiont of Aleiodes alternator TaxID=3139329 RepID=UPI003CCB20BB
MNTFLKVFLTQRLQFCVYFILDVHFQQYCNIPHKLYYFLIHLYSALMFHYFDINQ